MTNPATRAKLLNVGDTFIYANKEWAVAIPVRLVECADGAHRIVIHLRHLHGPATRTVHMRPDRRVVLT